MFSVYNKFGQLLVQSGTVSAISGYDIVLPNESDGTFQRFICKNDLLGNAILVPMDDPETDPVINITDMVYNHDTGKYHSLICKNDITTGKPYLTLSDLGYA